MRLADLRGCLNQIIVETTREKLDQIDKEKLEWYFDKACPACGEYHKIGSMRQPGKPIKYMCGRCRFEWIKEKT
jgi:ribosomal protein S27AE